MEPTDLNINVLIKRSAEGDSENCKKLYDHLIDRVYAFVRYRTRTKEHAVDLAQDVFIDLFSSISRFTYTSTAQFYAYVFVITRRKLAQYYEQSKKQGVTTQVEFDEETMAENTRLLFGEMHSDVANALLELDEQTREIIVLHHWSRYTFGEIGLLMNLAESAIRVRHHRGLKKMREIL